MTRWRARRRIRRSERGAVAIIVALSMTGMLVVAAMVVDFGMVRADKIANQSASDAAAEAGIQGLGVGDSAMPFGGACTALAYLKANDPEVDGTRPESTLTGSWKDGTGLPVLTDPCLVGSLLQNVKCVPDLTSTWAWYHGTAAGGRISVDIKTGYQLPDPTLVPGTTNREFPEDFAVTGDNGNSLLGGCDQLAVIIEETEKPGLGSLANTSDLVTRVRSVARTVLSPDPPVPVALLMLERHDCNALAVNSSNTKVEVLGNATAPGAIHADSLGDGACANGGRVLYGKFAGGIVAHKAEIGSRQGLITTTALSGLTGAVAANASDGASNVCSEQATGSCGPATGRGVIGRGPVDRRYLTGVRAAIQIAQNEYGRSASNAALSVALGGGGYTVIPASGGCNNMTVSALSQPLAYTATKVFVDCPNGVTFNTSTFRDATSVVFSGDVGVGSNQTLSMPVAQQVYAKGVSRGAGLNVQGNVYLNQGVVLPGTESCATRLAAPAARLVIGNGAFTGGAQSSFHLCNTTVLMAGNNGTSALSGTPPSDGSTSTYCPLPTPPVAGIGIPPYSNSCGGYLSMGAGSNVDWTAPNLVTGVAVQANWDNLEDLALWTETSTGNGMGGSGTLNVSGVFVLPNANPFSIGGGSLQSNGANAQFISRRLEANGGGALYMRPNLTDAVTIPLPPTIGLVR